MSEYPRNTLKLEPQPKPDHTAAIAELQALLARLQANRGGTLTGGVALAIDVLQGNPHGW